MAKKSKSLTSKPRLGRGLSSLIKNSTALAAEPADASYQQGVGVDQTKPISVRQTGPLEVPTGQIGPNPYQPRQAFDEQELATLAESIRRQGVLQPLVVTLAPAEADRPYILVAGERRLRAARQADIAKVPCVVRPASREEMLEWALVENLHRSDLNPIERGQAYRQYMDRFGLSQAELSERLGLPRTTIANSLRILDLCDEVHKMLLEGILTFGHAKVLAGLIGNVDMQITLARKVAGEGLSVRQLEKLIAKTPVAQGKPTEPHRRSQAKPPHIRDLEEQLTRTVGTRVTILPGRAKHTGRIVVDYYNLDDFDRVAEMLGLGDKT